MEDDVGIGEDRARANRQEIRIPRSRSGEDDLAHRQRVVGGMRVLLDRECQCGGGVFAALTQHRRRSRSEQSPVGPLLRVARDTRPAQPASHAPHQRREGPPFLAEHRLDALAQRAGDKGTLARGGDRDLKRTALHERGSDPVALRSDVDDVEEHALAVRLGSGRTLALRVVARIDRQVGAHQVTGLKRARDVDDGRAAGAKALGFLVSERGVAEHDAAPLVEVEDDRVVGGRSHPAPRRADTSAGSGTPATSIGGCRRHSLCVSLSHHQRPARSCSPGWVARVQGAQPIDM